MSAQYIVRLDDACPTMLREIWDPIEEMLDELCIKPIVGVIPENKDPSMECAPADPEFWERVRGWQRKGWTIALHGLHHVYHTIPAHAAALIPIHDKSEFVGLTLEVQREMIRRAYARFISEGLRPNVFMAPSHTFDVNTLQALTLETDIRIVTDGYALFPYKDGDFTWVPQQLWRFRQMPFGVWTVALHPNTMSKAALEKLMPELKRFGSSIVALDSVLVDEIPEIGMSTRLFRLAFMAALKLKRMRGQ